MPAQDPAYRPARPPPSRAGRRAAADAAYPQCRARQIAKERGCRFGAVRQASAAAMAATINAAMRSIHHHPSVWVQKDYPTLTYFQEVDRGGHFAAWEEPELFATEIRAAFNSLRSRA